MDDKVYNIIPMPKPRMTRRDAWTQRECVNRYNAFKDNVALEKLTFDEAFSHIVFIIPMPGSWGEAKKERMNHTPHQQENADVDNLCKALMDAVYKQDGAIWDIRVSKIWGHRGAIVVSRETMGDNYMAMSIINNACGRIKCR